MLKYQSIAPAPTATAADAAGKARKYTPRLSNVPYAVDQTQSVQRRNARERNRVKQVNNSFAKLRQHIPQTIIADLTKGGGRGPQKKISKVDTLRIAVEYIRRLQDLVDDLNGGCDSSSSMSDVSSISFCSSASSSSSFMSSPQENEPAASPVKQESKSPLPPFQHPAELTARLAYQQHQQQQPLYPSVLLTPESLNAYSPSHTQLDTVCHSPSSSFNSSMSFDSGTFEPTPQQLSPPHTHAVQSSHLALKFEPYDNFHLADDECTPDDDDEILDYISLWQEQ